MAWLLGLAVCAWLAGTLAGLVDLDGLVASWLHEDWHADKRWPCSRNLGTTSILSHT